MSAKSCLVSLIILQNDGSTGTFMSMKVSILHPAKFKLDGGAMYGIIPKPLWEKHSPSDEFNRIDLDLRLVLLQTATKNILIDTGIGSFRGEKWNTRFAVESIESPIETLLKEKCDLTSSDITDIILTHLHFDHVGGLGQLRNGEHELIFEQATIHLHRDHYLYALNPTLRDSGSFEKPIFSKLIEDYKNKNQAIFYEGMEGELECGLKFICSHGHTPFMIHPYSDKFIYMADIVPTSNHISIPWVMGYDISPGQSTRDKESFYKLILEKKLCMIFEHDPVYWGASLKKDEKKGYQADKLFKKNGPVQTLSF